ncbi:disease resistance protein RGA2-like, partial [Triticum dicoccoides]|uniref:disease resistance protein RGA2-like n=1 Tax=Triticum dicoccoides TaxID=85692 RepID=UPI00188E4359
MEILIGEKGYHDVDNVVESWSNMLEGPQSDIHMEQVRVCAEIAIKCMDNDPAKRPDTQHIISRLIERETMDGYIHTGVTTSQQLNPDMLNDTMHALWMRYQRLNPDIKRCFKYCSIFPRRSKLRRDVFVRMWIAQGFIKINCETEDMEDVAEGYVQELVSCSFLQRGGEWHDIWFSIPDPLHDLLEKI